MNSKDIKERFNCLNIDNKITCTSNELQEFICSGLIFKSGKDYISRSGNKIKIKVFKDPCYDFDIDLNAIIAESEQLSKDYNIKRIFIMNESCYNKYKNNGLIITKDGKEYYRLFESELWLVCIK